jgi:2'-5' RNA ligase
MRKMYAVELFFESKFEGFVRDIWKGLSERNISSNMQDIVGIRPHITLAVYNDIPQLESFIEMFVSYFQKVQEIKLKFDVLACFPTSGTLFIDPTVTEELILMHKRYHDQFQDLLGQANQYYIPDNWDPHCTLAIKLAPEEILMAMNYCYQDFKPRKTRITEVGIIKIEYDETKKCMNSPTLISKKLQRI